MYIDIHILQILSGCQTPELSIPLRTVILEKWRDDRKTCQTLIIQTSYALQFAYNKIDICNKVDHDSSVLRYMNVGV